MTDAWASSQGPTWRSRLAIEIFFRLFPPHLNSPQNPSILSIGRGGEGGGYPPPPPPVYGHCNTFRVGGIRKAESLCWLLPPGVRTRVGSSEEIAEGVAPGKRISRPWHVPRASADTNGAAKKLSPSAGQKQSAGPFGALLSPGRSLTGKKKTVPEPVFPKKPAGTPCAQPWLVAVGGWRLAVGNWRLVAVGGGWQRLVVGDWWLVAVGSGWQSSHICAKIYVTPPPPPLVIPICHSPQIANPQTQTPTNNCDHSCGNHCRRVDAPSATATRRG